MEGFQIVLEILAVVAMIIMVISGGLAIVLAIGMIALVAYGHGACRRARERNWERERGYD